jgi:hypothetical protein
LYRAKGNRLREKPPKMSLRAEFFNCVLTEELKKGHPESECPLKMLIIGS